MKSDYITRAKKFVPIVDEIIYSGVNIDVMIEHFNRVKHRKIIFASGLTRYAFITSDYVIKVDYNPYEVHRFGGCEDEMEIYRLAKEDGMEYLFAEITHYKYNGHDYYIMPRIHGIGRKWDDANEWMTEEEINWIDEHGIFDLHYNNYGWRDGHVCLIDYGAHIGAL